jgi:two-component system phosphate regulon sensor histidine kinase PhoR
MQAACAPSAATWLAQPMHPVASPVEIRGHRPTGIKQTCSACSKRVQEPPADEGHNSGCLNWKVYPNQKIYTRFHYENRPAAADPSRCQKLLIGEHRQMQTIGFLRPVRSALSAGWDTQCLGSVLSHGTNRGGSDFSATLLAMAGHDLRQPLQLITSAHDVLAQNLAGGGQREELRRARDATAQLARMLGQLVEALQLREQSGDNLHIPVPLRPILEDLEAELAEMARRKGITLVVTAARATAVSHPVLLTGMLRNLIRNAIDYTPPGGGVIVTSRRCGPELRIEVRDTGAGIRANALSRIFSAFQRADDTRPDGLGLGLFIVKHAADLLGHRVEVHSAEGRGSCFTVVASAAQCSARRQAQLPRRSLRSLSGATVATI